MSLESTLILVSWWGECPDHTYNPISSQLLCSTQYSWLPHDTYPFVTVRSYQLWGSWSTNTGIFTCFFVSFWKISAVAMVHSALTMLPQSLTTQLISLHLFQFQTIFDIKLSCIVAIWWSCNYFFLKKSIIFASHAVFMPSTWVCCPNVANMSSTLQA